MAAAGTLNNSRTPCASCKQLRRCCPIDCIFAPYFPVEDKQRFDTVHQIYGSSNVARMLQDLPVAQRADAVNSLVYEASFRKRDPVYGCAGAVYSLQKQIDVLQMQLALARTQMLRRHRYHHHQSMASSLLNHLDQQHLLDQQQPQHHHLDQQQQQQHLDQQQQQQQEMELMEEIMKQEQQMEIIAEDDLMMANTNTFNFNDDVAPPRHPHDLMIDYNSSSNNSMLLQEGSLSRLKNESQWTPHHCDRSITSIYSSN